MNSVEQDSTSKSIYRTSKSCCAYEMDKLFKNEEVKQSSKIWFFFYFSTSPKVKYFPILSAVESPIFD